MANTKRNTGRRSSKYEAPKPRRITKKQIENATYKDVKLLEKFISDRGKIRSSLITGITKQEQAKVARLIKVANELRSFENNTQGFAKSVFRSGRKKN